MINGSLLREASIAVAEEKELSVQCMWQHYRLQGTTWETISSILFQLAINESMRVEVLMRIFDCLGEPPLKKPGVCVTENTEAPDDMLWRDIERIDKIIASYEKILALGKRESCLLAETMEELLSQEKRNRKSLEELLARFGGGLTSG